MSAAAVEGVGSANVYAATNSNGRAFACVKSGDLYDYYHALVEQ